MELLLEEEEDRAEEVGVEGTEFVFLRLVFLLGVF